MRFPFVLSFSAILLIAFAPVILSVTLDELVAQREKFLADETNRILGGGITLDSNEQLVNTMLMEMKTQEYDAAYSSLNFAPAIHYFLSKPTMLESQVYQFIQQMPKGIILFVVIVKSRNKFCLKALVCSFKTIFHFFSNQEAYYTSTILL